jgi:hypothetical protein
VERDALQALRNKDITVLPADKGNATAVLPSEDYRSKIRKMFSDPIHRKLTADPTNKIERRTTALIKKSEISEDDVKRLTPHASAPPRMYGLPKIHKKDVPLRPIVNCICSPIYALAKYLTDLLRPLVDNPTATSETVRPSCKSYSQSSCKKRTSW